MSAVSTSVYPRTAPAPAGPDTAARSWSSLYAVPLAVFIFTRVLMLAVAAHSSSLLPSTHIRANRSILPRGDVLFRGGGWTQPWFRFDTRWYVEVAQHGYYWAAGSRADTNFLPFYPLLIRLAGTLIGSDWAAAWLISNLAALAALALLWRWALEHLPRAHAMRTVLYVALFPTALFFTAPYAEPVFLALALAAFLCAEHERWPAAIALAGLACVTRPVGLAVVAGLAALALSRGERRHALAALAALAPLAAFSVYLGLAFGRPLGFLVSHSGGWVRPRGGLMTTLGAQFHTYLTPFDRVDAVFAALFLLGGMLCWRKIGAAYGTYVLIGALLPLVHGLVGMERYVLVLFPVPALWAGVERRLARLAILAACILGLVMFTAMYAAGYTII